MTPPSLETSLRDAITQAVRALGLGTGAASVQVTLEPPRIAAHGDLATSVALQLAKAVRRPPLEIAERLAAQIQQRLISQAIVDRIEVKSPGFINFFLSRPLLYGTLTDILARRDQYGRSDVGRGTKVQVEFVSANPTGPLSVAHGRQAAVGLRDHDRAERRCQQHDGEELSERHDVTPA